MANEKAAPDIQSGVPADEMRAAFSGIAVHSNKVYATNTSGGVRLAFMEMLGDTVPPQFRSAVLLSYPDALSLRDLLSRQLKDFEAVQAIEVEIGPDGTPVIKRHGS